MRRRRPPRALAGSTIVVTGASTGLGAELAVALAAGGARLVLGARRSGRLDAVAERCRAAGADTLAVPTDVTRDDDCRALVECAVRGFGGIDVVVAAAGLGMWARFGDLAAMSVLGEVMDVNYWGVVQPAYHALPHLRASGGMLVAVSSVQGRIGVPWHSGYAAAKHAVQGFCDTLRMEEAGGVEVLTVMAHWIRGTELRARALGADGRPRGEAAAAHRDDAVAVDVAAQRVIAAMRARRRSIWIPRRLRVIGVLAELLPALADRIVRDRVERENGHPRR